MLPGLRPFTSSATAVSKRLFHVSAVSNAKLTKKKIQQIKQNKILETQKEHIKRAEKVKKDAEFLKLIISKQQVENGEIPDSYITIVDSKLAETILKNAPEAVAEGIFQRSGIHYSKSTVPQAKAQADITRRIISLQNQNSVALLKHNLNIAVKYFARFEGDTASPEVQAGVFTVRIANLADHLRNSHKDHTTRRIYTQYLHKRQKILRYLKTQSLERYYTTLKKLGLTPEMVENQIPFPKRVE
ncbi:hypothetical protein BB560_004452 [Smittium megazygosporum]|uniref:Ribosomal protein S15 n=1 Tax=Smittium megazygosporum TaxID=133381 RepID=A0A2T9Z986_9FUNG|nr:hypothetical protein BB560_004452 [Smittium megazygosporum]